MPCCVAGQSDEGILASAIKIFARHRVNAVFRRIAAQCELRRDKDIGSRCARRQRRITQEQRITSNIANYAIELRNRDLENAGCCGIWGRRE